MNQPGFPEFKTGMGNKTQCRSESPEYPVRFNMAHSEAQRRDCTILRGDDLDLLCVAGDLNMTLGDCGYPYGKKINRMALLNTLGESGPEVLTTFEMTRASQPDLGVIDHIAVSGSIAGPAQGPRIIPKRNEAGPLSDHTGVVVDVDNG